MSLMKNQGRYASFSVSSSSIAGVFGWMFYGLLLTFATAFGLYLAACNSIISVDSYLKIMTISSIAYIVYAFAAIFLMAKIQSKIGSVITYSIYALLFGAMLSSIFIYSNIMDVIYALGATSLVFGIMALYGYFTKKDLTGFGSILTMFLIGVIILSFINLILYLISPTTFMILDAVLSYVLLGIIIGYVAFDVQRVKRAAEQGALANSLPVYLAFNLYIDFIYIFIRILDIINSNK